MSTATQADLTGDYGAGENSAGVKSNVLGVSEDGTYVYFVASGVLASGGVRGADNLYVRHDNTGAARLGHIATLSDEDENDWSTEGGGRRQKTTSKVITQRTLPGVYVRIGA